MRSKTCQIVNGHGIANFNREKKQKREDIRKNVRDAILASIFDVLYCFAVVPKLFTFPIGVLVYLVKIS